MRAHGHSREGRDKMVRAAGGTVSLGIALMWVVLPLEFGRAETTDNGNYVAQVFHIDREVLIDAPSRQPDVLNRSMLIDDNEALRVLLNCNASTVRSFGLMPLQEGRPHEIDRQEKIEYATDVDQQDNPTNLETRGVGDLVKITLDGFTDEGATLDLLIESVRLVDWIDYNTTKEGKKPRVPVFASRAYTTWISVPFEAWYLFGGLMMEEDQTIHESFFLFRIVTKDATEQWSQTTWTSNQTVAHGGPAAGID